MSSGATDHSLTRQISLRQLRYLAALGEHRHFGRAAASCAVSQPSLSTQIQQLEAALGVRLLERTPRGVVPTAVGARVIERAQRILAEIGDLVQVAQAGGDPLAGTFRLGVIPTVAPYLLPHVMPALRAARPTLRPILREDKTAVLLDWLERGALDAAILALPVAGDRSGERFEAAELYDEAFFLAVPPGHPLAASSQVTETDLADQPVLLLEEGHCFRDQALPICRYAQTDGGTGYAATSLETLRHMVASGVGLTLLPALALPASPAADDRADSRTVARVPFAAPSPGRTVALVWRRGAAVGEGARLLADLLRANAPPGVTAREPERRPAGPAATGSAGPGSAAAPPT